MAVVEVVGEKIGILLNELTVELGVMAQNGTQLMVQVVGAVVDILRMVEVRVVCMEAEVEAEIILAEMVRKVSLLLLILLVEEVVLQPPTKAATVTPAP